MPKALTVKEPTLRELIEAGSVSRASAPGTVGGFSVVVEYGGNTHTLVTARGEIRLFPNLTTLASFLGRLGIRRFEVNTHKYKRARLRPARPDRVEPLRRTRTTLRQAALL